MILTKSILIILTLAGVKCWKSNICLHSREMCDGKSQTKYPRWHDVCCQNNYHIVLNTLVPSLQLPKIDLQASTLSKLGKGEFSSSKPSPYIFEICNAADLLSVTDYKVTSALNGFSWENYLFPLPEAISVRMKQDGLWEGYIPRGIMKMFPRNERGLNQVEEYVKTNDISPIILDIGSHVGVHGTFFGEYFKGSEVHAFDLLYENSNMFACSAKNMGFWLPNEKKQKTDINQLIGKHKLLEASIKKLFNISASVPAKLQSKLFMNLIALVEDDQAVKEIEIETNDLNRGQTRMASDTISVIGRFEKTVPRKTSTLDNYWKTVLKKRTPFLMKMDVEGSEWGVLKGAKEMFKESPPLVLIYDIHPQNMPGEHSVESLKFLRNHGYVVFGNMPSQFEISVKGADSRITPLPELLPIECMNFDPALEKEWKNMGAPHNTVAEWALSKQRWTKHGEAELTLIHKSILPGNKCDACTLCESLYADVAKVENEKKGMEEKAKAATTQRISKAYQEDEL